MDCSHNKIDKLVLVVHGVGDPEPGETLTKFARSIVDETHPLEARQDVIWLPEKSNDSNFVTTFATHTRKIHYRGQSVQLAEVFWGDLSRVRKGLFGVVLGLFQILFGLRYVAYVAADQNGAAAHWLKRLGLISSRILHGPVLAVTFFLAILAGAVIGTHLMWPSSYRGVLWTQVVLACCCAAALVTATIGWRTTRSRVVERFWFWVSVTTMFVSGLMVLKIILLNSLYPELAFTDSIRPGLIWYCRVLVVLLGFLWFAEIVVLLAMAYAWLMSIVRSRNYPTALHVAFLLPALAVGIWGQALPMVWLTAKQGVNSIAELPDFAAVFDEAIPLLGVQFLMMIVIGASTAFVVIRYFSWKASVDIEGYRSGDTGPRLIVDPKLKLVLAFCTTVGVFAVLLLGSIQLFGASYQEFWFGRLMAEINKYAIACLVPLAGMMALLLPHLRSGFDILLDVVNHFYFRPTSIKDALHDDDEFDINETTFENGELFFSERDKILSRCKKILAHFRDEMDHRPELVLVSHSQGTMVAIESLNDPEMAWLRNCFSSVTLVTMGSPFSHLYQYYFFHIYPRLTHPFWTELRKQTDRWVNVYRIDDYVGRDIAFPAEHQTPSWERCSTLEKTIFSNHPVGPRGHQSYWTDVEVLEILRAHAFDQVSSDKSKKAA